MDQHTFVAGCLAYYAENYYEPGNPEDGDWEDCHYPEPECLGGVTTIKLLRQHHAIQGILQSDEYQYPCVFGWERCYLPDEYLERFQYWKDQTSAYGGNTARMLFGKRVRITYPDGTNTTAYSINQAAQISNVSISVVRHHLRVGNRSVQSATHKQRRKPTHNLAFEYAPTPVYWDDSNPSKPKPIIIHYPDHTTVYAESIKHASRLTNINQSTIQHRLKRTVDDQLSTEPHTITRKTRKSSTAIHFEYIN